LEARDQLTIALAVEPANVAQLPGLGAAVELACFRIAQEALTNAARHSRAKQVHVALRAGPAQLLCEIRDDGCGFDPAAVADGHGLTGMRDRAALLGGEVEVAAAPGRGCRVTVRLPLSPVSGSR
ncbi:MAG: ATP-binding protein, partial [Deltaproteobacteria bacterium]|nr:ATP-binding protein [Deltaproteobacteria bacterium]